MQIHMWLLICWIHPAPWNCCTRENSNLVTTLPSTKNISWTKPSFYTYIDEPICQKTVPNKSDTANVFTRRTTLSSGFFQYERCCFHKHAMHCDLTFCQYPGGKSRSFALGFGLLSSSTRSMFSLLHEIIHPINDASSHFSIIDFFHYLKGLSHIVL